MTERGLYSSALLSKPNGIWIKDHLCYPWFDCDWFAEPMRNDIFLDLWLILNPSLYIDLFLYLWLIVFPCSCPWFERNILIGWLSWILHYLLILFPVYIPWYMQVCLDLLGKYISFSFLCDVMLDLILVVFP